MKKLYLIFSFCLLNLVMTAQTTITFKIDASGEDVAIDDFVPGRNNPNEIEYNTCAWTIGGVPVIWRDFFKFDLRCIPPNATIVSAGLNLYHATINNYTNTPHQPLTNSNESVLQRVTSSWGETTTNWNNQPSVTTVDQVILPQSTSGTQDYLNIDVKNIVQTMVTDPHTNYGFLLKLTNEQHYARLIFASGDNPDASKHPTLEVVYTIPKEDCITFTLDVDNEDAAIDDFVPGRNNPNEIEYNTCAWTIGGVPVIWRDVFKFDLPCELENAFITSSHLSLFYAAQNNYSNTPHQPLTNSNESVLQRVTTAWTETSVDWINQPTSTSTDEVILPQSTSGTQDYPNIDVTNMVRSMQANTSQNYGFMLKLTNEQHYARLIFASGDNPDLTKHPQLEICYSISTSVNEINDNDAVVFPNPFVDELSMTFSKNLTNGKIILYDALGQIVFSKENLSGNHFRFQGVDVASGLYFYQVTDKNSVVSTGKVQKQL